MKTEKNSSQHARNSSNAHAEGYGKIDFVGKVGLFGGISLVGTIIALIYLAIHGLNYGIDFAGGTEIEVKFAQPVKIEAVREFVKSLDLKNYEIQQFSKGDEFMIRFQMEAGKTDKETNEALLTTIARAKEGINTRFKDAGPDIRRIDSVGPQVGAELQRNGFLSVFYCLMVILIYVALRFDYKYAPGAVACLFHDAAITLAVFVAVGKEVNVPILAAIMTLIGYSLNDTIVVFDRIRETEHKHKEKGIVYIINRAINDMLGRTLITSGTVFVSALCLYLIAGGMISDIAFALCVGILIGTYSSIYVAAPMVLMIDRYRVTHPKSKSIAATAT
jgi:preprotein translocase subunit SecF